MRSEKEMLDLILDFARQNEAVRVVVMNGSRANPNAKRDPFQDFDIVYFVNEVEPFTKNRSWIDQFGERIILQTPEEMGSPPPKNDGHFSFLMLFTDGNRIDLSISPLSDISSVGKDSQTILLLDKDGAVSPLPAASDKSYLPTPPTAKAFADSCNEFWWVSTYVAKALWRRNLFQARDLMECFVRQELMRMLDWYFGLQTNFMINPGKLGSHYAEHLAPEIIQNLESTYMGFGIAESWKALFAMGILFRRTALEIANHFGFEYPSQEDEKVTAHLEHVRRLPADTTEIY